MERNVLIALLCLGASLTNGQLFPPSHNFLYRYSAEVHNDLVETAGNSTLKFSGNILIETQEKLCKIRIKDFTYNGLHEQEKVDESDAITLPFILEHTQEGKLAAFYAHKTDFMWSVNLKKGIASLLQLDVPAILQTENIPQEVVFEESNVHGNCTPLLIIHPLNDTHTRVRKVQSPASCNGRQWSHTLNMKPTSCERNVQKEHSVFGDREYTTQKTDGGGIVIDEIKSVGAIISPAGIGEHGTSLARVSQRLTKIDEKQVDSEGFDLEDYAPKNMQVTAFLKTEFSESSVKTKEIDLDKLVLSITDSLRRVVEEIQSNVLTPTNLPNTNVREMDRALQNMKFFNVNKMLRLNELLSEGSTDIEKEMKDVFWSLLPFVGTYPSSALILKLVTSQSVTDRQALKLLQDFPFYIQTYDVQLLKSLEAMRDLKIDLNEDVRSSALLSFATLLSKTIDQQTEQSEQLDLYVDYFINEFKEAKEYEMQMLFLNCLRNIGTKKVAEILEPLIKGEESDVANVDYKLRSLALFATAEEYTKDTDAAFSLYWSLLSNKSEHLQMRSTALTLLMKIPSTVNLKKLITFMQDEEDQQLYSLFYTKLEILTKSRSKCSQFGKFPKNYLKQVRKPINKYIKSSQKNYDYFDTSANYGEIFQGTSVGDVLNNLFASEYREMSEETNERAFNDYSLFWRVNAPLEYLEGYAAYYDGKSDHFLTHDLKTTEVILMQNNKVFLSKYGKESVDKVIFNVLFDMEKLNSEKQNFLLNYHTRNLDEQVFITTDLGTPAVILSLTPSHFRIDHKANETDELFEIDTDVKVSTLNSYGVVVYNPFADIWHGGRRVRRTNWLLPIRYTTDISYELTKETFDRNLDTKFNVNKDFARFGAEVFGTTESYVMDREDCKDNCLDAGVIEKIDGSDRPNTERKDLWHFTCPMTGMTLRLTAFDCQNDIDLSDLMGKIKNFISNENKNLDNNMYLNYFLGLRSLLEHFKNSLSPTRCGLGLYVEPTDKVDKEYNIKYYRENTDEDAPHLIVDYSMKVESKDVFKLMYNASSVNKPTHENMKAALTITDALGDSHQMCLTKHRQRDVNSYSSYWEHTAGTLTTPSQVECPADDWKFTVKGNSVPNETNDKLKNCEGKSRLRCLRDRTSLLDYKYDVQLVGLPQEVVSALDLLAEHFAYVKPGKFFNQGTIAANIEVKYNTDEDSIVFIISDEDQKNERNNVTLDSKYLKSLTCMQPENYLVDKDIPSKPHTCEFDVDSINNIYAEEVAYSMPSDDWTRYFKEMISTEYRVKAKKLDGGHQFAMRFEIDNSTLDIFPTPTVGVFKITLNETEPLETQNGVITESSPFIFLVDGDRDHNVLVKLKGEAFLVDYNGTNANIFFEDDYLSGLCRFPPSML